MRLWLFLAALNGFIAVGAGAFGAHGLARRLDPQALGLFETAVRYHFWHALALFAVAWLASLGPSRTTVTLAGGAFIVGIGLFCGSLYVMAVTGNRAVAALAPIGGVAFLLGWLALAIHAATGR